MDELKKYVVDSTDSGKYVIWMITDWAAHAAKLQECGVDAKWKSNMNQVLVNESLHMYL